MSRNPPICALGLRNLIAAFNTRVRRDPVLAPVLAQQVGTSDADWAAHVAAILQIYIAHAPLLPAKAARRGIAITASRCARLHFD